MSINNFFIDEELKEIEVQGDVFKFKPVTAGDELDWINDYIEDVEEKDGQGNKIIKRKQNLGKLSICKLRNIVAVPFSKEDLKKISGIDKEFGAYSNQEKDALFRKINPDFYNELVRKIDELRTSKKKE